MSISLATATRTSSLREAAATLPGRLLIGLSATVVVALAAHVAIPLPFTPIPLTLQPLAVLGVGLALGPVDGFFAMLAYLAEGAMGLPVFSPTGLGGLAQLLGPSGGFLLSYPLVAAVSGGVTRQTVRRLPRFAAAIVGTSLAVMLLFVCGACWLSAEAHLGARATWFAAVAPFLPGEAVKVLIAAGVYRALTPRASSPSTASK